MLVGLAVSVKWSLSYRWFLTILTTKKLKNRVIKEGVRVSLVTFLLMITGYDASSKDLQSARVNTNICILLGVDYLIWFKL